MVTCFIGLLMLPTWQPGSQPGPHQASAQQPGDWQQRVRQGPVELSIQVDKDEAEIIEPITLEIQVDAPAGTSVSFPAWGGKLGELTIVQRNTASELPLGGSRATRRWVTTLSLEALETGAVEVPPIEVQFRLPDDDESGGGTRDGQIRTEPIVMTITSVLESQEDPSKFRDIKGVADLPSETQRTSSWPWAAAGLMLLAATAGAIWTRRRRQPDPTSWAINEVDRIQQQAEANTISLGDTYSKLSILVREYLQSQWSIPATSQSSEELCHELERASCPDSVLGRLQRFLSEADQLKFAGPQTPRHDHGESPFDSVRAILQELSRAHSNPGASGRRESSSRGSGSRESSKGES